ADLIDSMIDPVAANRPKSAAAVGKSLRIFLKAEEEERQSREEEKIAVPIPSAAAAPDGEGGGPDQPFTVEEARLEPEPSAELPGEPEISRYFRAVMKHQGSDLHLAVGTPPLMRLRNVIRQMDLPPLTQADMERLVAPILTARSRALLEETGGADFAFIVGKGEGRFRVNLFK